MTCDMVRRVLVAVLATVSSGLATMPVTATGEQEVPAALAGTWTGTSICVDGRPACKNEIVVYRFIPVDGKSTVFHQLADKIIEGKRVPMGALDYEYDDSLGTLECEFQIHSTHGIWSYTVKGDTMTGQLNILPGGNKVRDVNVHRVADSEVPAAPALEEYEE